MELDFNFEGAVTGCQMVHHNLEAFDLVAYLASHLDNPSATSCTHLLLLLHLLHHLWVLLHHLLVVHHLLLLHHLRILHHLLVVLHGLHSWLHTWLTILWWILWWIASSSCPRLSINRSAMFNGCVLFNNHSL